MRRFGTLTVLIVAMLAVSAGQAQAARAIRVSILQDGKEILRAGTSDNGRAAPKQVWTYLKEVRFRQKYAQNGYQIIADKDNPAEATITGKLELTMHYGGTAKLKKLRLQRTKGPKGEVRWGIHPEDYQLLLKLYQPRSSKR